MFDSSVYQAGDRIELDYTTDICTQLRPGDQGVIRFIDDLGTLHVNWDTGSKLGIIPEAGDRIHLISRAE